LISVRLQIIASLGLLFQLSVGQVTAQEQQKYPKSSATVPYTPASGRCLTAEQRKVNDAYNALNRPTRPGDEMPFWDPEYLVGTWDIDMRTQDSPFGAGGESTGTLKIETSAKNGCLYQGVLKAESPDGKPFTRIITATYDPIKKVLRWSEKDSRGYTVVRQGPIGGELGGLFHHHFGDDPSTPVTTIRGHMYRFKGVSEMSSPAYFRTDLQISADGAPFKTFGRVNYEKRIPAGK
jgi:hypothetical protein